VFIVRGDIENDFRETVLARMAGKVHCELAFQEMDSLIPPAVFAAVKKAGRTKPWGTTHALLCAAGKIEGPFAVINADDFYGREAFAALGAHLCGKDCDEPAIVPYRLDKTLSSQGTVARGVCEVKDGYLVSVDELTAIERKAGKIVNTDGSVRSLADDSPVSMNFWGFPAAILPAFRKYFDEYLQTVAADITGNLKSECFIPRAVDAFIKTGEAKVKVITADSDWFGVTYREDRETAIQKLSDLTRAGIYPEALWH